MPKYYSKEITVSGHTRYDPRAEKTVNVHSYSRNQRYRNYETVSISKARELFNQRSERAKTSDLSKTTKKVLDEPNEYWAKNIGKSDVKNIDTKKVEEIKYAKNYEWVKDISEENLKKHIGATEQAIYLLNGDIKREEKFLQDGYDLTKEVLGEKIAEREKKKALDTLRKAKGKIKEKEKDLKVFNKELNLKTKKTKENVNKDLNELIKKFENKTEWKKTTEKIESFGGSGKISKDKLAFIIDSDSIRDSEWYNTITKKIGYLKIKPSDKDIKTVTEKDIEYIQLPTSSFLFRKDYYEDAVQNFKDPTIHLGSNSPVIIEGKEKSMVISPYISEKY